MGPQTLTASAPRSGQPAGPGPEGPVRAGPVSAGPVPAGEVHVWLVPVDAPLAASFRLLDGSERERAAGFFRPADGARFAASRAGLRRVLGGYLDADPAALRFAAGRAGKPGLAPAGISGGGTGPAGLEFSLARTADLALIAVSATAVGADVERIAPRPGLEDLIMARFSGREARCIAAGCIASGCIAAALPSGGDQPGARPRNAADPVLRGFYRHWTAREAHLKALGCGLAGFRHCELSCGRSPAIWFRGEPAAGWALSFPALSPAHVIAVVARHPVTWCRRLPG
jgi:4'-phosphopantetheinyl transferase